MALIISCIMIMQNVYVHPWYPSQALNSFSQLPIQYLHWIVPQASMTGPKLNLLYSSPANVSVLHILVNSETI